MARTVSEIIVAIEAFQPSDGEWSPLDGLLEELFQGESASQGIEAMLQIFERYPTDDGAGGFWAIHGLESLPGGYESKLVQSLRRKPSRMALTMVCRLLNGGDEEAGSVRLVSLVEEVAKNQNAHQEIREFARKYIDDRKP